MSWSHLLEASHLRFSEHSLAQLWAPEADELSSLLFLPQRLHEGLFLCHLLRSLHQTIMNLLGISRERGSHVACFDTQDAKHDRWARGNCVENSSHRYPSNQLLRSSVEAYVHNKLCPQETDAKLSWLHSFKLVIITRCIQHMIGLSLKRQALIQQGLRVRGVTRGIKRTKWRFWEKTCA